MEIYFISDGNSIKIGMAVNSGVRLRALQTGTPHKLILLHSEPISEWDDPNIEKVIHYGLRNFRIRGEWFKLNEDTIGFMEHVRAGGLTGAYCAFKDNGWFNMEGYNA